MKRPLKQIAGQRLDACLQARLKGTSRSRIKQILDGGRVFVNGKRVLIAGWKVRVGDSVEVRGEGRREGGKVGGGARIKIYHEDRDVIVVEKPAGISTVSKDEKSGGESLESRVRRYLKQKYKESAGVFVEPLHRLDKGTSGVVVFATSKTGMRLAEAFKTHSIQREYVAIVHGRLERENGVINRPLEKGEFGAGRKVKESEVGKKAVTEYSVTERYGDNSLLKVRVRTGRTHQIRVHLAGEGHPIIGDEIYSGGAPTPKVFSFGRHALHATLLAFTHPASGAKLKFKSNMPRDMEVIVDKLREGVTITGCHSRGG